MLKKKLITNGDFPRDIAYDVREKFIYLEKLILEKTKRGGLIGRN